MQALFGQTLAQLGEIAARADLPPYAARQIAGWLYARHAGRIEGMTDLPRAARERLAEEYEVGRADPVRRAASADGTLKYLFPAGAGRFVESAVIPDDERRTLCLSTQIGCRRACRFCMTGRQGFHGNLSAGEILNQFASLPERDAVTNIVYMGMGEPLDNVDAVLASLEVFTAAWGYARSPSRLTVSTVGLRPALDRLIAESRCHIALSVHSPFPDERRRLVPSEAAHPVAAAIDALRSARFGGQRRVMIEYIPFAGVNDTPRHAAALARLLRRLHCGVNLIPFNPVDAPGLAGADRARIEAFQSELARLGFRAMIRKSRGGDIAAACGLLSTAALPGPA